ncbi:MAG: hypothetical protein IPH41_15380 [Sulfuritalea sp.]|nr:hypothetical protein [Sulfuritalea sp.]
MRTAKFSGSTVAMAASLKFMRPSLADATSSVGSCFDLSAARRLVIEQRLHRRCDMLRTLASIAVPRKEAIEYLVGNVDAIDCIDIAFMNCRQKGEILLQLRLPSSS